MDKLTIHLTSEQQEQIKQATGSGELSHAEFNISKMVDKSTPTL
jgi:type VI protein secretion system component Hcp